ncbi:hypothetical protein HJC23_000051 [Cyclotella cryptica]|uniref:GPI ethanolamine phosphate transferase 1 n=1 Tax=Cyclotella cryptica TaxID=29204 RepID=A0ABD3PIJ8_9STRA|eukprot:CCRYP_014368-RA/>CCRYP_014368-RA protein AED:0.00 eAED:0.00 QI:297/-1/1/1/-1/1/1/576/691
MSTDAQPESPPTKARLLHRLLQRPTLLLLAPYLLGLLWTSLHPLLSIVTGELKCRGIYIDENGLDVHRHRVDSYPLERVRSPSLQKNEWMHGMEATGMCDALRARHVSGSSIECLRHKVTDQIMFDVVMISPSIGPMVQSPEAIVLVINDALSNTKRGDWYDKSDLHASVLHLIQRLGSKKDCPWLAKTVFVVSPVLYERDTAVGNATSVSYDKSHSSSDLNDLVEAFLSSYSGKQPTQSTKSTPITPLPPSFSYPLIRSLLVLSNIPTHPISLSHHHTEVRILPHGKGGNLPNLDLVFATVLSFQIRDSSGTALRSMYNGDSEFRVHPFRDLEISFVNGMERFWSVVSGGTLEKTLGWKENSAKKVLIQYAQDLGGWLGFVSALILGRSGPHAPALERGIDSLTIELRVPTEPSTTDVTTSSSTPTAIHTHHADLVRCTEQLLRAMSNLHERLHHSVAQYTMPSLIKFVSHGEYIFPAILVSLPLVGRAAMLALRDLKRFRFVFAFLVTGVVCAVTIGIGMWSWYWKKGIAVQEDTTVDLSALGVYLAAHLLVVSVARRTMRIEMSKCFKKSLDGDEKMIALDDFHNSLRFLACICGIYLHVPLLLANYALGFSSSVFWTPLLAILVVPPSKALVLNSWLHLALSFTKIMLLVATAPPVFLVPRIFGSYTTYVNVVYTPLNLMLSALWMS